MFFDILKYVYSETQYTRNLDKTHMLQKFPSDKINGTKNVLFSFSFSEQ